MLSAFGEIKVRRRLEATTQRQHSWFYQKEPLLSLIGSHLTSVGLDCWQQLMQVFQVINFYLQLVKMRSADENYPQPLPKVYAFNTFFYTKLTTEGYTQQLKRWTRKVDIFSFDILLIPVHLGVHWCLAVSKFDFQVISMKQADGSSIVDMLGGSGNVALACS